jgi:GT2 family glycosyltransferase
MQPQLTLRIVIVNFNTSNALRKCIVSLLESKLTSLKLELRIVDNHSTDDSLDFIDEINFQNIEFQLIKNNANLGFGKACNQGAENFTGKYILFLNPDCFLSEDVLEKTINYFQNNGKENVGIIGIKQLDERLAVSTSYANFPSNYSLLISILKLDILFPKYFKSSLISPRATSCIEVDQIMGSFFLVKNDLFLILQGFDEQFFMYYEEVDFSLRASNVGAKSIYFPFVTAIHIGGKSSENFIAERLFYNLKSRWLFWKKHMNFISQFIYLFIFILEFILRVSSALVSFNFNFLKNTLKSYYFLFSK